MFFALELNSDESSYPEIKVDRPFAVNPLFHGDTVEQSVGSIRKIFYFSNAFGRGKNA